MEFHRFNESFCKNKNSIFFVLNNREENLKNSKFSQLLGIISKEYNKVENCTKLTIKHKHVLSKLEEYDKNQSDKLIKYSLIEKELIEIRKLIENSSELRKLLVDLHKTGSIIYFDDEVLREIIISDPKWFNIVFKSIMDYGRKKIAKIIEYLFELLKNHKDHENLFKLVEKKLKELKNGLPFELDFETIWIKHKEKANVDKISFYGLLKYIENIELELIKTKGNILEDLISRFSDSNNNNIPISQVIYSMEKKMLSDIINEILGNEFNNIEKKRFLIDLLVKYDLILPKRKIEKIDLNKFIEFDYFYLVPFLFPEEKPSPIYFERFHQQKRNEEWEIKYFLPFKPSSMWKILFLKIRKCCVLDEKKQSIENELYWKDGFIFDFSDNFIRNLNKITTIVQMEIIENKKYSSLNNNAKKDKNNFQVVLEIKIKSNYFMDQLFESIDQSVKEFISKWIVGKFFDQITYSVQKRVVGEKQAFKINEKKENKMKIICFYCSNNILVNQETLECDICHSKNFLIGNKFAILKEIGQGGFGRVFKCIEMKNKTIVAIKERKDENKILEWKKEMMMMKLIEKEVSSLIFPRIICSLDDQISKMIQKYIVLEFVDGGNMRGFNQKFLKYNLFNNENHFIEMMKSFFLKLKLLHDKQIIHRDIKPENMMYQEINNKLSFFFVDFGSSHKMGSSQEMIETYTPNISPPEQSINSKSYDLKRQNEKSDIYSLSRSFSNILYSSKIEISPFIQQILDEMSFDENKKRISIDQCLERISNYSSQNLIIENKKDENAKEILNENNDLNIYANNVNDNRIQDKRKEENFKFCERFEDICSEMKIFCEENNHTPLPEVENLKNIQFENDNEKDNVYFDNDYYKNLSKLNKEQLIKMVLELTQEKELKEKELKEKK